MEALLAAMSAYGFPMVVAAYLLVRVETRLDRLGECIQELARAIGAIVFSVVIGALMHLIFLREERAKAAQPQGVFMGDEEKGEHPLWKVAVYFLAMVGILVFANWGRPSGGPFSSCRP